MPAEPSGSSVKCQNCGRDNEPGFRFCDACGTKLQAGPTTTTKLDGAAEKAGRKPLVGRWRDRRRARAASTAEAPAKNAPPVVDPVPTPVPNGRDLPAKDSPPKAEPDRVASQAAGKPVTETVTTAAPTPSAHVPPSTPLPPRIVSRPTKAEDLRAGRPGIAGRLRWQEAETAAVAEKTEEKTIPQRPAPAWSPAPVRGTLPPRSAPATVALFVLHVLIAFAAGAVLLGIAATVASLTSDGGVALLEGRGLPILIAGSTAIIVFSLLRTGPRARGSRRAIGLSVLIGFVLLVAAVALVYQPSLMADAQRELDRTLGVFGAEAAAAVQRFEADVDQWNTEVDNYREHLRRVDGARDDETDPERLAAAEEAFRVNASGSEEGLDSIFERMRSHAEGVEHAPLREALEDLAAIFSDELSGIKLITRGFVEDDQALIQSGNTRFTNATDRAVDFFDERVLPLLERGDIDPTALQAAVNDLRG